jgi:hypothetical protein
MDALSYETYNPAKVSSNALSAAANRQATVYEDVMRVCLNEPTCEALMFWDVAEYNSRAPSVTYSWLLPYRDGPNAGHYTFPTPFWDINAKSFKPKPAWDAMKRALLEYSSIIGAVYWISSSWDVDSNIYLARDGVPSVTDGQGNILQYEAGSTVSLFALGGLP